MHTLVFVFSLVLLPVFQSTAQQLIESWTRRYSHAAVATDKAHKVATDNGGNLIVAGETETGITGFDMLIIKLSGTGIPLWTNRYNGPGNADDFTTSLAVDGNGNIYLAGYSHSGTSHDFATIAYSPNGVPLWTNRYDGLDGSHDQVSAIALGSNNNVYVTGYSRGLASGYDYVTIAYTSVGAPLWTNRYSGPGNGGDYPTAIAVDGGNKVFVTGYSTVSGTGDDYATVAYSSTGVPLWTNRHSLPGFSEDRANSAAVDGNGRIYVTGYSGGDYLTIAYSNAGLPLWTNRYNGPANFSDSALMVIVDKNNNVIVTGQSVGVLAGPDYATLAYSSTGTPLWTNRFNGPVNGADIPTAIALDSSNNVYVTGRSPTLGTAVDYYDYVTIAYSSTGSSLWTNRYSGSGNFEDYARSIAVGPNNDVFVTGYSYRTDTLFDWITVAYSGNGISLWTNRFNGVGNRDDSGIAVATDGNNNIYVTGVSFNDGTTFGDYATVAFSADGTALWTNRFSGYGTANDGALGIAAANNNRVFVTGTAWGNGSSNDIVTIAYSTTGQGLWTNWFNGTGNRQDQVNAITTDGINTVYLVGWSENIATNKELIAIAYSGDGTLLWASRSPDRAANAVAVDSSNNVYVAGCSLTNGSIRGYTTVAFSNAGVPLWTNHYGITASSTDEALAIAVDASNVVYVTGSSFATIAYSSAGTPLWTNRHVGHANALAVAENGNVYVTGYAEGAQFGDHHYVTIAYSRVGLPLWTNRYDGPGNGIDRAEGIVVDANGRVYVTGWSDSDGGQTDYDYATIVYSSDGTALGTNRYDGPAHGLDSVIFARCIALAPDGVVVAGTSDADLTSGHGNDYGVVKYIFIPTNQPPISTGFGAATQKGQALSIAVSNLLSVVSDPEGAVVTLVSISSVSTNGAMVVHTNGVATYIPSATFVGADQFSYIVSDASGATNTVAALIAVLPPGASPHSFVSIVPGSGNLNLNFAGIPGDRWVVHRATQLSGPWTSLGEMEIPLTGLTVFQDSNLPAVAAFYRASKL